MADDTSRPAALMAFLKDKDQFAKRFILSQVLGPPPSKRHLQRPPASDGRPAPEKPKP